MKRPAFQFYTADWRNNAKLRRCSPAARGVWMDVLCVLHDSDEYGVCRWPLADIANAANASIKLVRELVEKDVLKGADKDANAYIYTPRHAGKDGEPVRLVDPGTGPCWYSSRFVRDEWVRQRRGSATQFTPDNQPPTKTPKATPKGGLGERQGDGSTASSTSTSSVPNGTGAEAPKSPADMTKDELWTIGKSLLFQQGTPLKQCGSIVGKLCKDYGDEVVLAALRTAVVERPADALTFIKAICMRHTGQRSNANPTATTRRMDTLNGLAGETTTTGESNGTSSESFIDVSARVVA